MNRFHHSIFSSRQLFVAILSILLLSGCSHDSSSPDKTSNNNEPQDNKPEQECTQENCTYMNEGNPCDVEKGQLCKDGLKCIESKCYKLMDTGETCEPNLQNCKSNLECSFGSDGISTYCFSVVGLGSECNLDEFISCESPLECIDGLCRSHVYDECSDVKLCMSDSAVCYDGKCIETHSCQSDSECFADTYCCTESECKVRNVCIPYGEGPRETVNNQCIYQTVAKVFEADIQCEWTAGPDDPYPNSSSVAVPIMVAPSPHDTGSFNTVSNTLFLITSEDGNPWYSSWYDGVIRLFNGNDCTLLESIYDENHLIEAYAPLAIADVDNDGIVEIFALRSKDKQNNHDIAAGGIVSFKWSADDQKYKYFWHSSNNLKKPNFACYDDGKGCPDIRWQQGAIHDINDDGIPEFITPYGEVLNARNGEKLNGDQVFSNSVTYPSLADLDNDGKIEYINYDANVYEWEVKRDSSGNITSQKWVLDYAKDSSESEFRNVFWFAIGDFGTPGETPEAFDWGNKDGIAEFVATSSKNGMGDGIRDSYLSVYALTKTTDEDKSLQRILFMKGLYGGGAPTIGDFDNDKMPEIGVAFGDHYRVIDPLCVENEAGTLPPECKSRYVLWEGYNQDSSSYVTGSSIFDFDGNGQTEVVYADECFTRVYDGATGDVLFSARHTNRTIHEYPVIADVDNDGSAEILIGSTLIGSGISCPNKDISHPGIRCSENQDCTSGVCENNLCRCTSNSECNWRKDKNGNIKQEYVCDDPLEQDKNINPKKICRAQHSTQGERGFQVLRDRYDRWLSSRSIWNQYSYSITNINNDLSIPKTSEWVQNFKEPSLNNYRANSQGTYGVNTAPDITCKLNKDNVCVVDSSSKITLNGVVCNRGTKKVAYLLPASFYQVLEDGTIGKKYCTSYTSRHVPVGGCLPVSCEMESGEIKNSIIRMVANDDGEGGHTTVECNSDNNTDEIEISTCAAN